MNRAICALSSTMLAIAVALADPPTPPDHPENDYLAMGHGIYLMRDEKPEVGNDGNITVSVFSHHAINVGEGNSLDTLLEQGIVNDQGYDGGKFGILQKQLVKMDCVHRTYAVVEVSKLLGEIWRPFSTLPPFDGVFRYVCTQGRK